MCGDEPETVSYAITDDIISPTCVGMNRIKEGAYYGDNALAPHVWG